MSDTRPSSTTTSGTRRVIASIPIAFRDDADHRDQPGPRRLAFAPAAREADAARDRPPTRYRIEYSDDGAARGDRTIRRYAPFFAARDHHQPTTMRMAMNDAPAGDSADSTDYSARAERQRDELKRRALQPRQPRVIRAGYPGQCASCGRRFEVGDEIADALGGWAHLCCCVCAECGRLCSATDSTPVADGIGRVHTACRPATREATR